MLKKKLGNCTINAQVHPKYRRYTLGRQRDSRQAPGAHWVAGMQCIQDIRCRSDLEFADFLDLVNLFTVTLPPLITTMDFTMEYTCSSFVVVTLVIFRLRSNSFLFNFMALLGRIAGVLPPFFRFTYMHVPRSPCLRPSSTSAKKNCQWCSIQNQQLDRRRIWRFF